MGLSGCASVPEQKPAGVVDKTKSEQSVGASADQYLEIRAVHFTSGLSRGRWPMNSLSEFHLDQPEIYLWVQMRIYPGLHIMGARIFDGSGELVHLASWDISPTDISHNSWVVWIRYTIRKGVDVPGMWKFELYADGRIILEEKLKVLPPPGSS